MPALQYFDCHARIGRWTAPRPEHILTAEGLVAEMDRYDIAEALVHHASAWEWAPAPGNETLLREIASYPRLHPCFVALPPATREMPSPREMVAQLREAGGGAVRLFPQFHQYRLADWCCRELLEVLEAERVPVLLDVTQADWGVLPEVLTAHPALPVVLLDVGYRSDRYLYPLWERHQNLHVEIGSYVMHGGVEAVCARFGPERLLFGTGLPLMDPAGPTALLAYADAPVAATQLIAGANLRRLLAGEAQDG